MSLKHKTKETFSLLGRLGLSGALLWYLFSKIDTAETFALLRAADAAVLLLGFIIFLSVNFILLYRWFVLIRAVDLSVSIWNVFRYFFIGLFGNLFLPSSIGGDLIKILGLCQHSSQKPKVVASVILDRLSGFAAIIVVATCSFLFGYKLIQDNSVLILIALMGLGSLVAVAVLFNERIYSFGCLIFNGLPKIKAKLMEVHYDLSLLKGKPQEAFKAMAIACFSQSVFIFSFYFISKALHQDIPLIYFLIFVPLICIASAFPSIGGLGVREFGAAYLFAKVGVAQEIAVGMSLISFFFMVAVGLMGGVVYVFTFPSGRVQHHLPGAGPFKG
ncbi:MAG TPA: lysylphosphatidylglycerol synthase transmembrane domain-containing protein [Candidatus Omnitrophota bacterium]|nr:lysylphosphatidylglycerol synthase transmembrane domain-containing protein [Candidatus Omnitrophota bacterium]